MPLLRCQKCDQAYEVPAAVAVLLPSSLARCTCGELVFGLRDVLAASFAQKGDLTELDLSPYRVAATPAQPAPPDVQPAAPAGSRNVRIVARGHDRSIDTVFSLGATPLVIGRKGAHVELDDAELSIRHCELFMRGGSVVIRDCDSHTGTFVDGEPVTETAIAEGMHLVRAGSALICVELTETPGIPVTRIELAAETLREASPLLMKKLLEAGARRVHAATPRTRLLVGIDGPVRGREYAIPEAGLIVGREGDVRVPDEFLSRKHFSLTVDDEGQVRIKDLGSRNGTFLNTLPARNTRVQPGDQIRAGLCVFRVEER